MSELSHVFCFIVLVIKGSTYLKATPTVLIQSTVLRRTPTARRLSQPLSEYTGIYRYHFENFVLRVIELVDRAHQLVGVSLLGPSEKYEAMGGNTLFRKP
ncbi:hypothetical protein [Pseudomonas abietaniphila]|uniref:hypothetical protein n=1 Tax=Pseudomonas abietaniphila TaxID=89065 RepID=UPI00115FE118|nr:hypothetical protein [Pseudomonas abietaniphila]